ncbi:MAG: nucleoid occlusion factor SlmA [SAR86 cluster bacterium]|uniref:Nucleoid occlusion factor SlmA n=1 Tax=SAR86 cluster bacterium TaxID=2030880 RepID=A0A2A5CII2_9GAMM|nr:MAG: nucleoid occlusion factor SlmA [SAR86 cluster bacterium]
MASNEKISRRDHILQVLAQMLQENPGGRVTTATLAKKVGVSEAALYRHFPSKARMFEGLIDFIDTTLFSRISRIIAEESSVLNQCEKILFLTLTFAEKNPGITRVLNGDALAGEPERLRAQVSQIFERLETQLKQLIREAEPKEGLRTRQTVTSTANLLLAFTEGKISQYVRTDFKRLPTEGWHEQWSSLQANLFYTP